MNLSFVDIMLVVLFFQLLSISPFLLIEKGKNSRKFLGFFLLAKALCISNFIAFRLYNYTLDYFPHLFYLGSSFTILWGPLLYFYVKSVTIKNFKLKRIDCLHFIPFAVHFLYLLLVFHLHGAGYKREMIINRLVFPGVSNVIVYIVIELFIGVYTIYALKLNFDFSKKLKDNFSSAEKTNLNWLWFILLGFTAKWSSDFVYFIFALFKIGGTEIILSFSKIVLFVFVNYMIYRGFKQPEIFEGLEPESLGKNSLSENVLESYKLKLQSFMSEQKLFLDPELSLKALSEISEIPQRSLSEVIKIGFGQNFYDFVNSYRIEEAKKLLIEPTEDSKSVLEILYEAGFKSKSSFHKAFSKQTGLTPTQFRNSKKAV